MLDRSTLKGCLSGMLSGETLECVFHSRVPSKEAQKLPGPVCGGFLQPVRDIQDRLRDFFVGEFAIIPGRMTGESLLRKFFHH